MGMEIKPMGRIRKLLESIDQGSPGDDEQLALTPQLELLMAAGAAPYREIVRVGRAFYTGTTTPVAAVVAIPTTTGLFSLYNNEPDGGRTYVIDWVAAQNVVSTAIASQAQLLVNLGQVREAAPTDAALVIKKANGMGGGLDTRARSILTATALPATTGIAGQWIPFGASVGKPGAGATPGYGLWQAAEGRFLVPPGRYFSMNVIAPVVGETFQGFIGWHEVQTLLG